MTTIAHYTYYDDHILECSGHTGFEEYGKDILCASVSILCYAIISYLEEAEKKGLIANLLTDISSGYAHIRFTAKHRGEAEKCFYALMHGFTVLSESFPDHILYEQ